MCYRNHIAVIKLVNPETLETTELVGRVTVQNEEGGGVYIQLADPSPLATTPIAVPAPKGPTMHSITAATCQLLGTTVSEVLNGGRKRSLVLPRQLAMYMCRKLTRASLTEIGDYFKRDHTSVISSNTAMEEKAKTDPRIKTQLEQLERILIE